MKFKISFLTVLFAIGFSLPSCSDDGLNCNCPPIEGEYFDIKGIDFAHHSDTELCCLVIDEVAWQDYALGLHFEVDYYSDLVPKAPSIWSEFDLMSTAYGCSCLYNGISGTEEMFEAVTIITQNDYNENYLAGDTITSIFQGHTEGYGTFNLQEFIEENEMIYAEDIWLTLLETPSLPHELELQVIIELNNGETYQREMDAIILE